MERFKGHDLQIIYYKRFLRMMHYFKLMIFGTISLLDDLIGIVVYVDRYPVAARYFESIFADMIFMPMRYDDAIDPGRIQLNALQVFFDFLQANARAINQNTGSRRPDSGAITAGTAPEHAYF